MKNNVDYTEFIEIVSLMGHTNFDTSLLTGLRQLVHAKYFSLLRIQDNTPTALLCGAEGYGADIPWNCSRSYSKKYHHYDDVIQEVKCKNIEKNEIITRYLCADNIFFLPYKQEIYDKNEIIQKLSSLYLDEQHQLMIFNLYRHKSQGYYTDKELENFNTLIPALVRLLQGHFSLIEKNKSTGLRTKLLLQQPLLTHQELEVCVRILQGMSYFSIATELGLKETTIKTYRNRAFEKLNIHFKNQLFSMFLTH